MEAAITTKAFNLDPLGQPSPEHSIWDPTQTTCSPKKDQVGIDVCKPLLLPKLCKAQQSTALSGKAFITSWGCTERLLDIVSTPL